MKGKNYQKDPLEVIGCAKGYSREELIKNLKRHAFFTPNLIYQIKRIPNVVLRNLGIPEARKINQMMREVFKEAYRAKQFTRTEINNRGVLYGVVFLKHNVIDLVLQYFHERWPKCVICLYNEYAKKTSIINESGKIDEIESSLKGVVEKVSKNRPVIPYFEDIQFSGKEIFETLYKSQYIPERENQPFFKKMIPMQCFELPGMRRGIEKSFRYRYKNLDYFLK
ncbi:MAG: DUF4130 domain-containing protein [Candidatus Heimdallarchaeota archaeon]